MAWDSLIRAGRRRPLFVPGTTTRPLALGRPEIERLIPHRPPLLLVDAIEAVDLEQRGIRARRRIDPADPVLAGHFPGDPIYPGVLLLETMAQASLCLQHFLAAGGVEVPAAPRPLKVRLLRVLHALFAAEARPGDDLLVLGQLIEDSGYTTILAGQVIRGETICAFTLFEAYQNDDPATSGSEP